MMNSNTRRTHPGDCIADADVSDEYVWSAISYLDPERENRLSNAALWIATIVALLIWGSLWYVLNSL